jgi:hypothetical protein
VFAGVAELGAMWQRKTKGDEPHEFLGGEIDFPGLPEPISLAVFFSEDGTRGRQFAIGDLIHRDTAILALELGYQYSLQIIAKMVYCSCSGR